MHQLRLNHVLILFSIIILAVLLVACGSDGETTTDTGRWYTSGQVQRGNVLFQANCAVCHGNQAQGLAEDWMARDSAGNLPPPPLNGTAHAWHHPMTVLDQVIASGGMPYGGTMPGFAEQLDGQERQEIIAFFQSFWTDEIYSTWQEINNQSLR